MKIYLLSIPDLEQLLNENKLIGSKDVLIRLYYAKEEVVAVTTVAAVKDIDITYVLADTSAEFVFDVGMFIGEQKSKNIDIELYCGNGVNVPDSLMQSLNIKNIDAIKPKRQPRQPKQPKGETKTGTKPETTEKFEKKAKPEKSVAAKEQTEKKTPQRKRTSSKDTDAKKTEVKIEKTVADPEKSKRPKKAEAKESAVKKDTPKVVEAKAPAAKESAKTVTINDTFLKQMSVRGRDLKDAKYSDDALVQELVSIFKNENSVTPSELLKMLNDTFSENDADVIYKWVKPNLKRLHELALTM